MIVILRSILAYVSSNFFTGVFSLEIITYFYGYIKSLFDELVIPAATKLAASSAYAVLIYALVMGYTRSISIMTDLLIVAIPAPIVGAWGWVMPIHSTMCLTFLFSAYSIRYFFDWYIYFLEARYKALLSVTGD